MNMELLAVVIPLYIYHSFSTMKKLWEEKFTPDEFTPMNMKNCGCRSVRKHRYIKSGEKYITLDISLKFGILEKMKIISSDPKDYLGESGKGLINSLGLNTIRRSDNSRLWAPE